MDTQIAAELAVARGTAIATAVEVYKDLCNMDKTAGKLTLQMLVHRLYGAEGLHEFDIGIEPNKKAYTVLPGGDAFEFRQIGSGKLLAEGAGPDDFDTIKTRLQQQGWEFDEMHQEAR